ncbi:ATP-grasp peptide maturase system methyltransferase [Kribbella solani]|uniref:ATP-grasp peptide maturase system methyltransferase n=1 Tax=Kribbella solani TaxID=236067 RepID=UPI0029B89792|nr:ATP-grasp peptide maturase system methyltransferase [Kribbella solani]MDX3001477.1 ATP-grasp peptide maturase system methyltransferase [Kribbella solani]
MSDEVDARVLRRRLADELVGSGDLRSAGWRDAVEAVPRELFIPAFFERIDDSVQTLWRPVTPELVPESERLALTYTNETWVTQLDHSVGPMDSGVPVPGVPTSSSTLPGLVVRMLEELQVEDHHQILEVGTGTGYSAALLSHRLGGGRLTSVEVDPMVADRAANSLRTAGYEPRLVVGDGLAGHRPDSPYDRVIATCSVRHIPPAWISQTKAGGQILTTMLGWLQASSGLVRLEVSGPGTADGEFLPGTDSFMPARPHEPPAVPADLIAWIDELSSTERPTTAGAEILDPWDGWTSSFIAQLAAPTAQLVTFAVDDGPMTAYLIDTAHGAFAALPEGSGTVRQGGEAAVWDAVEDSIDSWREAGSPELDRFRVRVTPDRQVVYYERLGGPLSWELPGFSGA